MNLPARIAVVGAGWAGLAAAIALRDAGAAPTVFEAGHTPGGRARRVAAPPDFAAPLDNGQHILLGAYSTTLALMRRLGRDPDTLLLRQPLSLARADGSFRLHAPRLPAPLHTMAALVGAHGLNWRARLAALRLVYQLRARGWQPEQDTVTGLLRAAGQPAATVQSLWRPLCIAALNTPPDQACAVLFCRVLRDALDAPRAASDLLLPRTDLSDLWPDAAAALCDMRYGHPVRSVQPSDGDVRIDGEYFDGAVLATPPARAARLLEGQGLDDAWLGALRGFSYLPIATLTVRVAHPVRLAAPMLMLDDDPARDRHGQWLFDRNALLGLGSDASELTVVASDAGALTALPRSEALQLLLDQIRKEIALPPVLASKLVIDKQATFTALPGLERPGVRTRWPRVTLAGDWTDTGYPGVLEGAVRSGQAAAAALLAPA